MRLSAGVKAAAGVNSSPTMKQTTRKGSWAARTKEWDVETAAPVGKIKRHPANCLGFAFYTKSTFRSLTCGRFIWIILSLDRIETP